MGNSHPSPHVTPYSLAPECEETAARTPPPLTALPANSMPPAGLATLITALHWRPFQALPMTMVPMLMLASYANLQGFKRDAAGLSVAASGTYALLALRRRPASLRAKFTLRGAVRGVAIALGAANVVAGAWVYATTDRAAERQEREDNPRWG